jgi:hypothetical protein
VHSKNLFSTGIIKDGVNNRRDPLQGIWGHQIKDKQGRLSEVVWEFMGKFEGSDRWNPRG